MAEVEIVLGTHNGARHLGAQLASFAGQSLTDWTLLVSDDGSTDETRDLLTRFGRARPGAALRIIAGPQSGLAANYLHLLQRIDPTSTHVALADQDDIWFPDKLRRGARALRRVPSSEPALYAAHSTLIDGNGHQIGSARRRNFTPSFENALVQNVMAGNTIMLNRPALELVKNAIPDVTPPFHDWWLYGLLSGAGARLIFDHVPVLAYRQHSDGVLGAHCGPAARATRLAMILNGTWRTWLHTNHQALHSVASHLLPQHRQQLASLISKRRSVDRFGAIVTAKLHRQGRAGTAVLSLAALAGLA